MAIIGPYTSFLFEDQPDILTIWEGSTAVSLYL